MTMLRADSRIFVLSFVILAGQAALLSERIAAGETRTADRPARTAALEVQAEPKIVATVIGLLERVSGRSRRTLVPGLPPYSEHVLASRPLAYWRLEEMESATAHDATGRENDGQYENGVAFFLSGADLPGLMTGKRINRAPHLAGGRLTVRIEILAEAYSIEFWFWNGLPNDARPVTGYLFGRASNRQGGDYLGLNGFRGWGRRGVCLCLRALGKRSSRESRRSVPAPGITSFSPATAGTSSFILMEMIDPRSPAMSRRAKDPGSPPPISAADTTRRPPSRARSTTLLFMTDP